MQGRGHRHLEFVLPEAMTRSTMLTLVSRAARRAGLRVAYVGGYGVDENSVRWRIAEIKARRPLVEATYRHEERTFSLSRPSSGSLSDIAQFQRALRDEFTRAHAVGAEDDGGANE